MTPLKFAALLAGAVVEIEHEKDKGLEKACVIVETEAKRVIGTYDYDWEPLAKATKEDRVRLGWPEDEPLLRSGEMRESIEHTVGHGEAWVGSNSMIAVYQELGTGTVRPRSFLWGAAMHKQEEVEKVFGDIVMTAFKKA